MVEFGDLATQVDQAGLKDWGEALRAAVPHERSDAARACAGQCQDPLASTLREWADQWEALIEDAANVLCWKGWWEPDADDIIPAEMVMELSATAAGCALCQVRPDGLADHYLDDKRVEWEQAQPVWVCDCGAGYKLIPAYGTANDVFRVGENGVLGDLVGSFKLANPKSKSKTPGLACPGCGAGFADTITRRANPQQSLF